MILQPPAGRRDGRLQARLRRFGVKRQDSRKRLNAVDLNRCPQVTDQQKKRMAAGNRCKTVHLEVSLS
jgi:hypothetical protein